MWLSSWQHTENLSITGKGGGGKRSRRKGAVLWRGRGGRDEGLDLLSLGLKASLKNTHAAAALSVRAQEGIWQFASKKKRELMKNEKLHLERSSVKNQEKEEEGEGGLHVALSPPLLLGNRSSSWTSWSLWWQPQCPGHIQMTKGGGAVVIALKLIFKRYPLMDSIQETK